MYTGRIAWAESVYAGLYMAGPGHTRSGPVYRVCAYTGIQAVHRACVHRLIPVYTGLYTVCRLDTGYAGLYTVYTHIRPVPLV